MTNTSPDPTDPLVLAFIPALINTLLVRAEKDKGAELTEEEVLAIRDAATCICVHRSTKLEVEEKRGYRDVDPDDCWKDWRGHRAWLIAHAEPTESQCG